MTEQDQTPDETPDGTLDVETIVPETATITVNGVEARVKRVQTRELLSMLRLVSMSVGTGLSQLRFTLSDPKQAGQELAALLLLAASLNQSEALAFVASLMTATDKSQQVKLVEYLTDNPDPADMLLVMDTVATQEAPDLATMAGKVQAMATRLAAVFEASPAPKKSRGGAARSRAAST